MLRIQNHLADIKSVVRRGRPWSTCAVARAEAQDEDLGWLSPPHLGTYLVAGMDESEIPEGSVSSPVELFSAPMESATVFPVNGTTAKEDQERQVSLASGDNAQVPPTGGAAYRRDRQNGGDPVLHYRGAEQYRRNALAHCSAGGHLHVTAST
ncbi:hypothetical protein Purlil1_11499 [Purpureocillium lilacinum]|uniref:Uncharacterized protein n=1 Tax=Purpureocillium lilacinum TaxID=33203 RepID=A0ABR0BKN0_PURLI|nr:hypothetical protein Purlil1_11499 [Purpureocillium lilacinum]